MKEDNWLIAYGKIEIIQRSPEEVQEKREYFDELKASRKARIAEIKEARRLARETEDS